MTEEQRERKKKASKKWYETHKARILKTCKQYYQSNRAKKLAYQSQYREMNIEKARLRSRKHYWAHRDELSPKKKIKRLQRLYGLSFEQVEQMYISQNGRCAICEEELESTWDICVDHDHQNGKVRGLLCRVHNTVLGMANDDTSLFLKAVAYLDKWKKFHNQSTNERENKC